jgi:hypothetical protein
MLSILFLKMVFIFIINIRLCSFVRKEKGCTDDGQWSGWSGKYIIYCLSVTFFNMVHIKDADYSNILIKEQTTLGITNNNNND